MNSKALDDPAERIKGEHNLVYAALHPFPLPGWNPPESIPIRGPYWQVLFKPDGAEFPEIQRSGGTVSRHVDGPNVLIACTKGVSDPSDAAKLQKPLIDGLRGLFALTFAPLLPAVWEGVLKKSSPDTLYLEAVRIEAEVKGITQRELENWGNRWIDLDPRSLPQELLLALRWYHKGASELFDVSGERVVGFIAMWLCLISLVRRWYTQKVGGDVSEVVRFKRYAKDRLGLAGMGLTDSVEKFRKVYRRRNELIKGGGDMAVPLEEFEIAAMLARETLTKELTTLMP